MPRAGGSSSSRARLRQLPEPRRRAAAIVARVRPHAVEAAAVGWVALAAARRRIGRGAGERRDPADVAELAAAVLGPSLITDGVRVLGPEADAVAALLADRWPQARALSSPADVGAQDAAVVLGLERLGSREAARQLAALHHARLVVVLTPVWPEGRAAAMAGAPIRTLRSRRWWLARAAEAGLTPALELRTPLARAGSVVLEPRPADPPPAPRPVARTRPEVVARINDDLSLGNSFAWISASIALGLADLGVPVSIAPTELSTSFDAERRERLAGLIERGPAPARVDAEIGWTHFWPQYQRPLGGRVPLALFAINYCFRGNDPAAFDPWLRQLVASPQPLAPISTFCRDVLLDAGVPAERLRIVPMGVTDGITASDGGMLPGARRLRLLHVTNAADLERNGTQLALDAFAAAFDPSDDVTLVVRDYGNYARDTDLAARALAGRGYDVRYWPVFFPQHRLGGFLGAFDALVAPFRGEGFGVKVLDAMACGLAPICPFFGGPRDFLDDDAAFRLDHELAPVRAGYDSDRLALGNEPQWAEPSADALATALRTALEAPDELERRGRRARERALGGFTWHHTAERILALLD